MQARRDIVCCLTLATVCNAQYVSALEPVDSRRDLPPILDDPCYVFYACHGPDTAAREANSPLDEFKSAVDRGVTMPHDASKLMQRVLHTDLDEWMPPADFHKPLTADETATLGRWIAAGANYQRRWSFEPLRQVSDLPVVSDTAWLS